LRNTGSENAHACGQNAENIFGFVFFLERYHKDGYEFLNHIVRVTGDETSILFLMLKTNISKSSRCTHIHQTSRKSLNKSLRARKLMGIAFWERTGKEC
jgi:hypothetical protein